MTDDASRAPDGPPSQPDPPPHRLLRSRDDRMIAGVCGGLAAYLGVDTTLIRIAAVILALSGGPGLIAYIIGWIAIPEARPGELPASPHGHRERRHDSELGRFIAGALLIGLGGLWLLGNLIPGVFMAHALWPLALIGVGVFIVAQGMRR